MHMAFLGLIKKGVQPIKLILIPRPVAENLNPSPMNINTHPGSHNSKGFIKKTRIAIRIIGILKRMHVDAKLKARCRWSRHRWIYPNLMTQQTEEDGIGGRLLG